ncbi:MAG TPA: DUF6282 family protein [Kofleriaceae bacterium]|jgi:hypothetical protein|nr:DUF6282 family protein [Kofleriaceae bacterium]
MDLEEAIRALGVVDTHYHVGPELLPRRYDVASLATAARSIHATLVLKNHTYPTSALASLARARHGVRFLGGVVLNRFVGGLNPDAVTGAVSGNRTDVTAPPTSEPPIVVWMPTVHAASHLRVLGHSFDPRWSGCCTGHAPHPPHERRGEPHPLETAVEAFDDAGRPRPELIAVLEVIARTRSRLATGHLSSQEILRLVPLALSIGVPAILITHPHYPSVHLSDGDLRTLTRHPEVFIEHCFAIHTIEEVPLSTLAASIRATGPEQVILSTDFGQVHSDAFPEGTLRYAREIERELAGSISRAELLRMFAHNGARALGIPLVSPW